MQIEHEVKTTHGFLPDLLCSVHQNARKVLGSTTPECYFPHPINSSRHDITKAKSLTYAARKVLGLGGKFIITPPFTTPTCHIRDKLKGLARDVALKVHFAGDECLDLEGSKLFVKSTWMPPYPAIEIDSRVHSFNSKLRCMFIKKKEKCNISKSQKRDCWIQYAMMTATSLLLLTKALGLCGSRRLDTTRMH